MPSSSSTPTTRAPSLLSLLADRSGHHTALSLLHTRALELSGGLCSLLFEHALAGGQLQVTSGSGLDHPPAEPWEPAISESTVLSHVFGTGAVTVVRSALSQMPNLHARLGTDQALMVPLVNAKGRVGLLVIGLPPGLGESAAAAIESSAVPAGFLLALELARLRQRDDLEVEAVPLLVPAVALREREELRGRLAQSEKLAALGQFVAGVAHELNNPLQSVLGHLELLRATGAVPQSIRSEIRAVARDAGRAARIVRHLLVFAGAGPLQRRASGVNGVVQRVLALRKASCRSKHIEVVRHYDQHLPRIHIDPILLHQVFLNIVMNAEHAVAATRGAGRIEVTTGLGSDAGWVIASIRDTGAGIDDDTLPRIFEPFYTTREVGQGTGLGLALAYGIVQEHGGRIAAGNHPEGGAVFTVELPIA